jgi:hypothetical protein
VNNGNCASTTASDVTLLANLKRVVADFAQREAVLTKEIGTKRRAIERKYREDMAHAEESLATQLTSADEFFTAEEERVRESYSNRRGRIEKGQKNTMRTLQARARAAKDKRLSQLQLQHLQAERSLPVNIKAVDAAANEFAGFLAEEEAALAKLEHRALRHFSGSGALRKALARPPAGAVVGDATPDELLSQLRAKLADGEAHLAAFRAKPLPKFFSAVPIGLIIPLLLIAALVGAFGLGFNTSAFTTSGSGAAALAIVFVILYAIARKQTVPAAEQMASDIRSARELHKACVTAANTKYEGDRNRVQSEYETTWAGINDEWGKADEIEASYARTGRKKISEQVMRLLGRNERMLGPRLQRLPQDKENRLAQIRARHDERVRQITETYNVGSQALEAESQVRWEQLQAAWLQEVTPLYEAVAALKAAAPAGVPPWSESMIENWTPSREFSPGVNIGQLTLGLPPEALPKDPRLALPGSTDVTLPVSLRFPECGSLLFETSDSGDPTVINTLNNVILRLFASSPPGKTSFTIIDPIGLGQNFAGLMHLSDYEESLIDRRIWTQRDQIEERLAELNEHIEKVIQMYLRNEFATITEYNAQAGSVAEKYHFVVIADFPANFTETSAKRLQSIAVSGPRCGVFALIHWDRRHPMPDGVVYEELRSHAIWLRREKDQFVMSDEQAAAGVKLLFDAPPDPALAATLIHKVGQASVDSNRIEVPFTQVAPPADALWTGDTTSELKVAIGRTGAPKLQYLAIGKGTRQHALFAGKTGSGKSTLFHVIITNLALSCSPEQVEFYLIDFKKGVEFKCYASKRLPHARVVAIESDREFGLSVLQRVDEELKRRGDLFRKMGVQDIPGYKRAGGTEPMPRSLLIIDEFQEFFVEDDQVAQSASLLFDRIVRQGRAFGIHVLLGSQTLGGAYTLARATLGQMVIRVALQCNEADAYLIMDDNNAAPRLLSRPGEGIYNDAAGAVEGNSPFQVVWLGDDERDRWLDKVRELADEKHDQHPSPIVFEGNAPADIHENDLLRKALATIPLTPAPAPRCWLGAPNSIKGPTEIVFHRQSGNHLLVVGQREESALTMIGLSMLALAAQHPIGSAKFYLFHASNPASPEEDFVNRIVPAIPHGVTVARGNDVSAAMSELASELKARNTGAGDNHNAPVHFVFIHGLQKFKKLRQEDDFSFSSSSDEESGNPGAQLMDLITDGSGHGIHLFVTVDTFNNVNRALNRKALSEFEMRVVFQMSANDSASLIDSPRASSLGLHRALFYNEQQGLLETFRPYAMPDADWIEGVAAQLARMRQSAPAATTS